MKDKYFALLLKLAKKASIKEEVPISALIVLNDKIIAKSYNNRNKSKYICDHAEMLAIKKASKKLKDWRLDNCELYVTLKPCKMCEAAINQSRIKKVNFLVEKNLYKKEYNKTAYEETNNSMQKEEYLAILKGFFQKKRDK